MYILVILIDTNIIFNPLAFINKLLRHINLLSQLHAPVLKSKIQGEHIGIGSKRGSQAELQALKFARRALV